MQRRDPRLSARQRRLGAQHAVVLMIGIFRRNLKDAAVVHVMFDSDRGDRMSDTDEVGPADQEDASDMNLAD